MSDVSETRPNQMRRPSFVSNDTTNLVLEPALGQVCIVDTLYEMNRLINDDAERCQMSQKCGPVNVPLQRHIRSHGCV